MTIGELIVAPDVVTIGGKLCPVREATTDEKRAFALRTGLPFDSPLVWEGDGARRNLATLLSIMYGVPFEDALAYVDEQTQRIVAQLLAEKSRMEAAMKFLGTGRERRRRTALRDPGEPRR